MSKTNEVVSTIMRYNNQYNDYYYPIKRSFGRTLNSCNLDATIAYANLSDTKNPVRQNKEFMVAGLCYNISNVSDNLSFVKFEDLLKRMVAADKSTGKPRKKEVEKFLQLRYDNNGYFAKRFYTIANKAILYLHHNETVDFIKLLDDLEHWDEGNTVKLRWAMTVANITENNNDKDKEND